MSVTESETVRTEWLRCSACGELVYRKRWLRGLQTCPHCRHCGRLTARDRIASLVDPGSFEELVCDLAVPDPLRFVDQMPYPERLSRARRSTGEREAVICGSAAIGDHPVMLAVMDFLFMGGSLGIGTGDLIVAAADAALAARVPLLIASASGGARMQEGILALMQMGRISHALLKLHEAGILILSLITDPTYGGVAASFATQADVIIAEPGARMGFAGPRVIRDTIGEDLPAGFQTAEFLREHGLVDLVVERSHLPEVLGRLLAVSSPVGRAASAATAAPVTHASAAEAAGDPWTIVQSARSLDRPTTRDYLSRICDWFVELRGDRHGTDSRTVVGGLGRIGDRHVVVVGTEKGHDTRELGSTNFGMASPEGYHKAMRLFGIAEKLRLPVVTLVDTPGAHPGVAAEGHGQAHTIAASLLKLAGLRTPVVSVVTGEGGSGGALALALADRVYMLSRAIYSVISPEGCAAILWTAGDAPRAAAALRMTGTDLLQLGVVDGVIAEPDGGAQQDHAGVAVSVRGTIERALDELCGLAPQELADRRQARWRVIGSGASPTSAVGVAA